MGAILSAIAGFFSSTIASSVARYLAIKAVLITLITVTLPIILHNFVVWFFDQIYQFVSSSLPSGGLSSTVLQFSGLAGYLAVHLRFPEMFAVIVTGISIRAILNFIPGLR